MKLKGPLLRITLFMATFVVSFIFTLTVRVAMGFKADDSAILVSLAPDGKSPSQLDPLKIKIHWGGYYVTKEEEGYKIFRLLDINPNQYHVSTYDKVFREVPNINDVSFLVPSNEHVALRGIGILSQKPVLFGRRVLSQNDLYRYSIYLEKSGYRGDELLSHIDRMIRLSRDTPLETKLSDKGGLLNFEQAGFN